VALDTRWKLPQGKTPEQLYDSIAQIVRELRKGDYLAGVASGLGADDIAFSATQRVLGRNTAGAGAGEEVTLSQLLDWIGSANRGDVLRRGASAWESLNVGTSGQVLTSDGTDPAWATVSAGLALLNSGTVSAAATLDVVLTGFTAFRSLKFLLSGFVPATDDVELWMRFSTNGGSTYDAGAGSYSYAAVGGNDDGTTRNIASTGDVKIIVAGSTGATDAISNVTAEGGVDSEITLHNQVATARWSGIRHTSSYIEANSRGSAVVGYGRRRTAQDTDAVRFLFESGNITSGNWALYGYA